MNGQVENQVEISVSANSAKILSQAGLSLVEILVSLSLIAIAGTFIAGKIFERLHEGRVSAARIQMSNYADVLKEFKRHCGTYPTTDQGLDALIEKPTGGRECPRFRPGGYLEGGQLMPDPWDNPFVYVSEDGKDFDIISYGNDAQEGGEGEDQDIHFKEKIGQEPAN